MYSQQNEESFILQAVGHLGPSRFLDIGAFHPTCFSNTRALFERGWGGVMVEPSPGPSMALLQSYGNVERISLVQAAIGPARHAVELRVTNDAVSTTDPAQYERWKTAATFLGRIFVPMITLAEIFAQFGGGFEFVNIDAEGGSVDILRDLLATEALPTCICVEFDNRLEEARALIGARGYRELHENGTNLVVAQ